MSTMYTRRNSKFKLMSIDPSLSYSENLVRAIDKHWGLPVAIPDGLNNVTSKMRYGLPASMNDNWCHPDMIHVKWIGNNMHITRKS